jgi:triacylglycerol lipase
MTTLTPDSAATIAQGVYQLKWQTLSHARARHQYMGSEDLFELPDSARFTAISGELAFKQLTGFGYIAAGKGSQQGEVLIATRGTDIDVPGEGLNSLADGLTDFNIGLQPGPSGRSVHAGFNKIWKRYAPEIRAFLRNRNPTVVHCVGHSLGGALAHLNAEMLTIAGVAQVKLYTFGSPRVGLSPFSSTLGDSVGAAHMYRVYNGADPVPMVPVFPFFHAPMSSPGHLVRNGYNGHIRFNAHLMKNYIAGVAGTSWANLAATPEPPMSDNQLEAWLAQTADTSGPAIANSATALRLISKAIRWILDSAGYGAAVGLTVGASVAFTLLDRLALLLYRAAEVSKVMAERVAQLIAVIFKFLGRQIVAGANLTIAFITWVLTMLLTGLRAVVHHALTFTQI